MSESQSSNIGSKAFNSDDILDILNEEEEDSSKEVKEKEDKEIPKEDDEDEEKEESEEKEEELELKEEEEEEPIDVVVPVSKKKILAKYPNVFKDFPVLEASYYKAQQYSEILPTLDDAKEAVQKAQYLDQFEQDLLSGNIGTVLSGVKESSPKAFKKIAESFLGTLNKIDESVALHIGGNLIKNSLFRALKEGERSKNEDLQTAAKMIHDFVFGSEDVKPPTKLVDDKDDEDKELNSERIEFERDRFNTVVSGLQTKVDNRIKATIDANIDPKNAMSGYVKKNAIRDAREQLVELIQRDTQFRKTLDSLWRAAKDAKFSSSSLDRISTAYLAKSRSLLPGVIRSARNEALKGIGKRESSGDKKGPLPANRSSASSSSSSGKAKEIPKGMSVKEFIMSD